MTLAQAKRRAEKLAHEYADKIPIHPLTAQYEHGVKTFKAGYNACHADMLPVLEQMAEALHHTAQCYDEKAFSGIKWCIDDIRAALAAYHAWRGEL